MRNLRITARIANAQVAVTEIEKLTAEIKELEAIVNRLKRREPKSEALSCISAAMIRLVRMVEEGKG